MAKTIDLSRYTTTVLPTNRIFCDSRFNSRGPIARSEIVELAKDIKVRGLDFPIHVQEYTLDPRYDYRIISGHRRFTAFLENKESEIPAVIRLDLSDELAAREANLRENVQRSDLTMPQEADAIDFFLKAGYNVSQVASRLGKSNGWVEVRKKLLDLPDIVRQAAAKGLVAQSHIHQLHQHRSNPEKLMEMIKVIKERAERGERGIVIREDVTINEFTKVKRPRPHEIDEFLEVVGRNITNKLPDDEECFAHKVLAWSNGHISRAALYGALRKETAKLGLPFLPPADVAKILNSVARV